MIGWVPAEGERTLIRNRAPLFLSGRAFTTQEIEDLQETVRTFWRLSWGELLRTVCEHLDWVAPTGRYKVDSCAQALRKLEALGWVKLPLRGAAWGREPEVVAGPRTDPEKEMVGTVGEVAPVELEPVAGKEATRLWNEVCAALPPARLPATLWGASAVLPGGERGASFGMFVICGGVGVAGAGPLDWMDGTRPGAALELGGGQYALLNLSLGAAEEFSQPSFIAGGASHPRRLGTALRLRAGVVGNIRGIGGSSRNLLPGGQLDSPGGDAGARTHGPSEAIFVETTSHLRLPVGGRFSLGAVQGRAEGGGEE